MEGVRWKNKSHEIFYSLIFSSPLHNLKYFRCHHERKFNWIILKKPISIDNQIKENCNLMKFYGELRKLFFLCLPVLWIHFVLLTKRMKRDWIMIAIFQDVHEKKSLMYRKSQLVEIEGFRSDHYFWNKTFFMNYSIKNQTLEENFHANKAQQRALKLFTKQNHFKRNRKAQGVDFKTN